MSYPSRDEILASSKGWVASFLNFLPGLVSFKTKKNDFNISNLLKGHKKNTLTSNMEL